jgi:UDP-N-acetylglucosamine 2-epimerase (non-hydrolysing)
MDKVSQQKFQFNEHISFQDPFSFTEYNKLQTSSMLVISDSGSVSEEASILGFRAVTLRDSMERPEALEAGTIILSSTEPNIFIQSIKIALQNPISKDWPTDYRIPNTSTRVVNFIISTIGQVKFWQGLR